MLKKIATFIGFFLWLNGSILFAQNDKIPISDTDYQNTDIEMADKFREDGKIYVVIAVISVILGGLITYLVIIDKKTSKLEKMLANQE